MIYIKCIYDFQHFISIGCPILQWQGNSKVYQDATCLRRLVTQKKKKKKAFILTFHNGIKIPILKTVLKPKSFPSIPVSLGTQTN